MHQMWEDKISTTKVKHTSGKLRVKCAGITRIRIHELHELPNHGVIRQYLITELN